uniref:Uncharacterized protein n=1 Tax=viral metagenome TaxID=1070528 RepID=A0A6C0LW98_9ZZZZ
MNEETKAFIILVIVLSVLGLIFLATWFIPCSKDKFKLTDKSSKGCNSCGACRGIGNKVPVNREYVRDLYEDGILTENSFRSRSNMYL